MEYFYSDGKNQIGPVSVDQLKKANITPDTLIWYKGLETWKPAKEIKSLSNTSICYALRRISSI